MKETALSIVRKGRALRFGAEEASAAMDSTCMAGRNTARETHQINENMTGHMPGPLIR